MNRGMIVFLTPPTCDLLTYSRWIADQTSENIFLPVETISMLQRMSILYDTEVGNLTDQLVNGWKGLHNVRVKTFRTFAKESRRREWLKWKKMEILHFDTEGFLDLDGITLTKEYIYDMLVLIIKEVASMFYRVTHYFKLELTNKIDLRPVKEQRASRRADRVEDILSGPSNVHSRLSVPEPETNPFSFHPAWETNRIWTTTQYITPISNIPTEFRDRRDSAIFHNTLGFHERQLGPEPDRTALITSQIEHDELSLRAICGPPPSPLDGIPAQRWREPRNDSSLSVDITDPVSSDSPAKYTKPIITEDLLDQLKNISKQLGDLHRSRELDKEEIFSLKKELKEIRTTQPADLSSKAGKSGVVKGQSSRRSSMGGRSDSSSQFHLERGTTSSSREIHRSDSFGMPRIPKLTGAIPKVRRDSLPKEEKKTSTKVRKDSLSKENRTSSPKSEKKSKSPKERKKDSPIKKSKKKEDKNSTRDEDTGMDSNVELVEIDFIGERKAKSKAKKQIKKDIQKMVREERKDQLAQKRLSTAKLDDSLEATEPKQSRKSRSHEELFKELSVHIDRVVVEKIAAAKPTKDESEDELYTDDEALVFLDPEEQAEYNPVDLDNDKREYHVFGDSNSVVLSEYIKNETEEKIVKHGEGGQ
ncbi:unnamed protein product [Rotaria socialis]|nr:unnamed protein product [Rotaria socialis]